MNEQAEEVQLAIRVMVYGDDPAEVELVK